MTKTLEELIEDVKNLVRCISCKWSGKVSELKIMYGHKAMCPRCSGERIKYP